MDPVPVCMRPQLIRPHIVDYDGFEQENDAPDAFEDTVQCGETNYRNAPKRSLIYYF